MISAKQQAFRQQIRRRQIEDKFRNKRKQYVMIQKIMASKQQREEFITQAQNIIYNLKQLANGNDYYMYQGLRDLKDLIKKRKKILPVLCNNNYQVIQSLACILDRVNSSGLESSTRILVFDLMMEIMSQLINCEEVTPARIQNSGIVQAVIPFLEIQIQKIAVLINLFGFLGNAVRESPLVAALYTEFSIPRLALVQIQALKINLDNPQQFKIASQFLFFLRCYFEETPKPLKLSNSETLYLMNMCSAVTDRILRQDKRRDESMQILQDSLKVYRTLINLQELIIESDEAKRYIDIIQINGYPTDIKRQALYIVDSMIYVGDDDFLQDLVLHGQMLTKIWGVDDELKYIVFNIMSNAAINPRLRTSISPFLTRVRLEINYNPDKKFVYRFVLNYFASKKFKVQGTIQQAIIDQIYKSQDHNAEVMSIEAKLWLGLTAHEYYQNPPHRIMEARHIPQVQQIEQILQIGNRRKNSDRMVDFDDDEDENPNKIISQ